ncbi:CHAP domain-containing protein, partial [Inquilinus limosus]
PARASAAARAPAVADVPAPRTQLTARNVTEQRQIQRVSALKAQHRRWSCVPFARELTGFQISGDAWRWWDAAAGRYNRGRMPVAGSVIVLKRYASMRRGHVAVVRRIVSSREIIVDQANWAPRGRVNEPARVIDVSAKNDWSQTRFWHQPTGQMGTTVYPTYGFIYAPNTQVAERAD